MNRSTTTLLTVIQRAMNAVSEAFGSGWRVKAVGGTALRSALRGLYVIEITLFVLAATPANAQQVVAPYIAWADLCNVPGYYGSGQAVCDARKALVWTGSGLGSVDYVPVPNNPFGSPTYTQQWLDQGQCEAHRTSSTTVDVIGYARMGYYCPYGWSINGGYACSGPGAPENGYLQGYIVSQNLTPAGNEIRCTRSGPDPDKNRSCPVGAASGGNPINFGFASKFERAVDIGSSSANDMSFGHTYNSKFVPNDRNSIDMTLGRLRAHPFGQRISVAATPAFTTAWVLRPDGNRYAFNLSNGQYSPEQDILLRLAEVKSAQAVRTGWTLTDTDDSIESYDANGTLQSITPRTGIVQTLAYNGSGQLTTVTDPYGRTLTFTYNAANATLGANNIATVTDHLGNVVSYAYDAVNNLSTVTYPGGAVKTYLYNEQAFTANTNLPNALTGITDENGSRFATYNNDTQGRAVSTEHAGGVEKYQLN